MCIFWSLCYLLFTGVITLDVNGISGFKIE